MSDDLAFLSRGSGIAASLSSISIAALFKDVVISILATIAKQERIRISERVRAGQSRARAEGKLIGRPKVSVSGSEIAKLRADGLSFQAIAERANISVATAFNLLKKPVA